MTFKPILTLAALAGATMIAGCATIEEAAVDAVTNSYRATLTGANEVGGGDPDGMGKAKVTISDTFDQVCYEISDVTGIGDVTAAHIHFGRAGTNGPPVLTLTKSTEGRYVGCKEGREWTQNRINGNPADFYVNLHTADYPNGAIRGQLMN